MQQERGIWKAERLRPWSGLPTELCFEACFAADMKASAGILLGMQ